MARSGQAREFPRKGALKQNIHPHRARRPEDELIAARKRLQEAKDKLRAGDANFADIVREYSQDPEFKDRNGDMGYLTLTDLPKELQDAIAQLQVGQISDLVQTAQGLWLVRLEDRKSFSTVRGIHRERL
jgi:parvulin-like peptidyl-prolyl isomerase